MGNHAGLLGNHAGLLGNHAGLLGNHVGLLGNHAGLLGDHVGLLGKHVGLLGNHVGLLGKHVGLPLRFGDGLVQPLDGCLPVVGVTVFVGDVLGVGVRDSGGFGGLVVEGPEVRSR